MLRASVLAGALLSLAAVLPSSTPALAGEGLFSRVYTTDTVPKGHFELEQLVRDRNGRAFGDYNALDFKSEFEYGITDDLQIALYLNAGHIDARHSPDDDDPRGATGGFSRTKTFIQSVSAELIYRVLSPYTDGIGLAFYLEPEWDFTDLHNGLSYNNSFGMEYRVILQKNFLDDRLIAVLNIGLETEAIRFKGEDSWAGELDWNNEFGITYRFAENWFGGLELRNHNEYGDFTHHEHSVFWAGPVFHYGGQKFWATLGLLEQVYGDPHGVDEDGVKIGDNLFLRSHEQHEVTLKIGFPF